MVIVSKNNAHHLAEMILKQDATRGTIDRWFKKEGDKVIAKESICSVTLDGLTIELNTEQDGYLADIIKKVGEEVNVDEPIALYITTKEGFMSYIDAEREASYDEEKLAIIKESTEESIPKFDNKVLLRELKHLIERGILEDGSGSFDVSYL